MARQSDHSPRKKPVEHQYQLFGGKRPWHRSISAFFQRISSYVWDLVGILLIAFALILLLGIVGVTSGTFVTPFTMFLSRWLGLGRFLLIFVMIVIGVRLIRWRKQPPERIALGRIVAFELSCFLSLGLLSIVGSGTVANAQAGLDLGGILGWGIAEIFRAAIGPTTGFVVIVLIFMVSLFSAFQIFNRLEEIVQKQLNNDSFIEDEIPLGKPLDNSRVVTEPVREEKKKQQKGQSDVWLPPEFRKSFETRSLADEKPSTNQISVQLT